MNNDAPAFTQFIACPICNGSGMQVCEICKGRGWKQQLNGYSMIVCPSCNGKRKELCKTCRGKRKLPEWDTDGNWQKQVISKLSAFNQEMMS